MPMMMVTTRYIGRSITALVCAIEDIFGCKDDLDFISKCLLQQRYLNYKDGIINEK
jgi:hypothetical protein